MSDREFLRINGAVFLGEITTFLQQNPKQIFADDAFETPRPAPRGSKLTGTVLATLQLYRAGRSIEQIARQREVIPGTILSHLADALEAGEAVDISPWVTPQIQAEVAAVFAKEGMEKLGPVYGALRGKYDYGILKLCRAAEIRAQTQR